MTVFGEGARVWECAELVGLKAERALRLVEELVDAGVLLDQRPLRLADDRVRAEIYGALGETRRRTLHRRAASILAGQSAPSRQIAAHLLHTDPLGDRGQLDSLVDAAHQARAEGDEEWSIRCLRRALEEPQSLDSRRRLQHELADLLSLLGHRDAVAILENDLGRSVSEADEQSHLMLNLARVHRRLGDPERAREIVEVGLAGARGTELEPDLLVERAACLIAAPCSGRPAAVASALESDLSGLRPGTAQERALLAFVALQHSRAVTPVGEVCEVVGRALDGADAGRLRDLHPQALSALVQTLICSDRYEVARDVIGELLDGPASSRMRAELISRRALLNLLCGDLAGAEADARVARQLFDDVGGSSGMAVSVLVEALHEQDREAEAMAELAGLSIDGNVDDTNSTALVLEARGRLRLTAGDPKKALADLLAAGEILEYRGIISPAMCSWRSLGVLAALRGDDRSLAESLAARELDLAKRCGVPRALARARAVAALLAADGGLVDGLEPALRTPGVDGNPLELARIANDEGAAMLRAQRRDEAALAFRIALDAASRCGAARQAARARRELGALGRRPRRSALTGPAALTPAELRVAVLAAQGLSNREIADSLHLAPKTIEGHLGSCFKKLEIERRSQLAAVIGSSITA